MVLKVSLKFGFGEVFVGFYRVLNTGMGLLAALIAIQLSQEVCMVFGWFWRFSAFSALFVASRFFGFRLGMIFLINPKPTIGLDLVFVDSGFGLDYAEVEQTTLNLLWFRV